jgi:hypothetical protein
VLPTGNWELMPITPKVRVEITAIDRATATIKGVSNQISNISSTLMKLGAAYATVRMGFAIFEQFTTKVADYGEQLLIGAQRTGMTTEQIAGLGLMAKQKGLELDNLTKALGIFSRNLVGLGAGGKTAQRVLADLGVGTKDATGKLLPMHDLLLRLADRFASMPAGPQKAAAAMAIFGREGGRLIPFLNEGAAGIKEIEKRAAELGITLDEKGARAAHEFGDQMVILGALVQGVALKIGMAMMPTLLQWTVGLENISLKLKEWKFRLEAAFYAVSAIGAAMSLHWKDAKGLWAMAIDASNDATAAEIAYEGAVSKSTGELDRRLKTVQALGDMPDEFGGPEKEKKAKARKSDLSEYIALLRELRPELEGVAAVERHYSEVLQRIAQLTGQYDDALLLRLAREEKAKGVTAAMLEEQKKLQESLKAPLSLPADLLTSAQTVQGFIPAFHGAGFAAKKFGEEMSHALTQMIVFGRGGIDMLKSMVAMLVEAILKAFVFKQIYLSLGGAGGVGGGGIGGFFAGFFGGLAGLQGGGTVSAGTPYLVGEAGPERFVPETAGAIVSNSEIGGNTVNNYIDARGADPSVEQRLRRVLREVHQSAVETAQSQIREAGWRSGA